MKKEEKLKEERLAELLKKADGHPMMKAILAEEAAAILEKRKEAAGKIEVLKKEQSEVIPRLRADIEAREEKYKKAKAALDILLGEFQSAKAELSSENNNFETAIRNQEAVLIESADPAIDEGIEFFRGKLGWLRSPGRISRTAGGSERNIFTMKKIVKEESNVDAINSALQYCMAAIKELERMKLTPALDAEKIERMKAGVPSIDVYTEVTGEKPMEKINTDPRSLFKSDSQMDWELGKLNEKFKKVMGK